MLLSHARSFLEVAELAADDEPQAAAALTVLAGIAAADAASCITLGERSRAQDHHEAERLVGLIEPGGGAAANDLRRLLDLKDTAHYGLIDVSGQNMQSSIRWARRLVEFAERQFAR